MAEEQSEASNERSGSAPDKPEGRSDRPERSDRSDRPDRDRPDRDRSDRSDRREGRSDRPHRSGGRRFFRRKKVDFFSVNKIDDINYKDTDSLKQFIGDRGKILPRRHTGLSAAHQRQLKRAIKRARNIALLPFAAEY